MIFGNIKDVEARPVKTFPYKGKDHPVVGTTVKWLSQVGEPSLPEYGLRFFTIEPGGYLPIHKHEYAQTEILISGKLVAAHYDNNDEVIEEKEIGPGEFFYVGPMEVHGMKNRGKEPATFFCCICVLG
jgi:quercetin dioxygenase-like cupin family protein